MKLEDRGLKNHKKDGLLEKLKKYGQSDYYPLHMPGHKRQNMRDWGIEFPDPFSIDITEIDGFDNLHHAEGILKESMEYAAGVYGADRSYYLVNGSTSGLLSSISAVTSHGGSILMGRNCHKAAYHAVFLNQLRMEYIYPQYIDKYGVQGGLLLEDLEEKLKTSKFEAVLVVSPTYDGVVSDIAGIARLVHSYGIPLIVDEAHGAHLPFGEDFPKSALDLGADLVIQSLHKTLPSFTQTAILHAKSSLVDLEKLERYLQIYQTSSPSYLFMASMDSCVHRMQEIGRERMHVFYERLMKFYRQMEALEHIQIMREDIVGNYGVCGWDSSKVVISMKKTGKTGPWLMEMLREQYHMELEMCQESYGLAIMTVCDVEEGFSRLGEALLEIDQLLKERDKEIEEVKKVETDKEEDETGTENQEIDKVYRERCANSKFVDNALQISKSCGQDMILYEALSKMKEKIIMTDSVGRISAGFVSVYPPGIPLLVPGQRINQEMIELFELYQIDGIEVQGIDEYGCIQVVKFDD